MAENRKMEAETAAEVELISLAIERLMEEQKKNKASSDWSTLQVQDGTGAGADNDRILLSRLLFQVASMKEEVAKHSSAQKEDAKMDTAHLESQNENGVKEESSESRVETEEIMKELKEVKRQNFITHCLVSAMIILTVAWQLSEVSIILKVRDGLSNPFKFLGSILKKKKNSAEHGQIEATELPHLKMPALPRVNLPDFDLDGE